MEQVIQGDRNIRTIPYQHEPLFTEDAVRVLVLEPSGNFRSPLRCSITQHQRNIDALSPDGCSYLAVSYTWGSPELSHNLFVRLDSQRWACLRITANVHLLLCYLRVVNRERHLWIDAICLNQKDETEKSQQIPLMGQIYSDANQVLIWLGDDNLRDAQRTFSLIRRIELEKRSQIIEDEVLCLAKFFDKPWFTRRWVIQEVFFSHDAIFQCGFHSLGLSRVMCVLEMIQSAASPNLLGRGSRMLLSSVGRLQRAKSGLLSLLWDVHESDCLDPRDRIAAVYSIADDDGKPPLRYSTRDWKLMYKHLAYYYFTDARALAACAMMLHLCAFGSVEQGLNIQNTFWVPDWSRHRRGSLFFDRIFVGDIMADSHEYHDYNLKIHLQVQEKRLRLICDPSYFQYSGVADLVISPVTSKHFWQDTIELVESSQTSTDELRHLFKLLEEVLTESPGAAGESREVLGYRIEQVAEAIFNYRTNPDALCDGCYRTLRDLTSALSQSTIVKVRSHAGYFWAIGPSGLVVGDWLISALCRTGREFTAMMCLRPTGTDDERKRWQYIPRGPEMGYGFTRFLNEVHFDSVRHFFSRLSQEYLHITSTLVGLATAGDLDSMIVRIPDGRRKEIPLATSKAEMAAKAKELPGPIVFDVV